MGVCLSEMVNAKSIITILNADTHPHIDGPINFPIQFKKSPGSLGKHLECMPRGTAHHTKDLLNEIERHVLVEKIAH